MRLVIHCGFHKTGTKSFQNFCFSNRAHMRRFAILYPQLENEKQHSLLMWRVQTEGIAAFGEFLRDCRVEAGEDCATLLLSGEDFENAIIDLALASDVERQAREAGFDEIVWVVVTRDRRDYAASIYAEMSKHGVVLHRKTVAEALEKRGCLFASTSNFNYIFVLDFARFRERFRAAVSGALWEFSMADFLAEGAGSILLRRLLEPSRYEDFRRSAKYDHAVLNKRLSDQMVERKYLLTALGLPTQDRLSLPKRILVSILAWARA